MGKYAKVIVRTRSTKSPDWGLGQGVMASQLIEIDDDEQVAAVQLLKAGERLMEETVHYTFEEITEEEWNEAEE